jgi:HEAT repeat protein
VERFHAALDASRRNDPRAVPELIKLLESDDAAVRLGASRELERITGQTMGYHHAESQMQRDEAIRAWRDWYESGTRSVESPGELANPSRTSVDIGARGG